MSAHDTQVGGDHYRTKAIQPIEFIMANDVPHCEACVIKYVMRHALKGRAQDLLKAVQYIAFVLEHNYGVRLTWTMEEIKVANRD